MSSGDNQGRGPWRKGEHSFEKGRQILDVTGFEIAWIRYNDPAIVDLAIAAPEMRDILEVVAGMAPWCSCPDLDCKHEQAHRKILPLLARIAGKQPVGVG